MSAPKRPKLLPEEQHAKFVEAAKKLGTDDSPERFKETMRQLGKAKPEKNADSSQRN